MVWRQSIRNEHTACPQVALYEIPDKLKPKIKILHDKGWTSEKIQKRYRKYTKRQIGALRGWMRRGQ